MVEGLLSSSIIRGVEGSAAPPPLVAEQGLAAWREFRTGEIARLGGLPSAELVTQLRSGLADMRRALDRLAAAGSAVGGGWHPAGVQPLTWFPGQWLVEVALHDWDIRVAADPTARVSPLVESGLGPEIRSRMSRCFQAERAPGLNGVLAVDLGPDAATAWQARFTDGVLELIESGALPADATLHTDAGTYALVQTARRPAEQFKGTERWRVEGNAELVEQVCAAFKGY
jgi:hypothetical protein